MSVIDEIIEDRFGHLSDELRMSIRQSLFLMASISEEACLAMLNDWANELIQEDETQLMPRLFKFFDLEKKPLTPIEFYAFFVSIRPEEEYYYVSFAFARKFTP